ncbi:MAG TPA: S1/P1 nuclease [Gemmatimonadales bacterium]|nr:S1/P1 nuclease [Gemmatimonadales bacterium]
MNRIALLLLLGVIGVPATSAVATPTPAPFRWGRLGHRVIARVAASQLDKAAKEQVRYLLGNETLASVATWGDEVRKERPETGNWHYIDIPITDSVYRPERYCPDGCVIEALNTQLAILANRGGSRAERAEALKWVVHLVEDLHQPLHVGERGDQGGNDVKLTWQGQPSNLHRLWDSQLLEASGLDENAWVARLEREIAHRGDLLQVRMGTPERWAMESHAVSRDVVYPFLPQSLEVGRQYYEQVHVILEDRLFRASVRLASLLNGVLGGR